MRARINEGEARRRHPNGARQHGQGVITGFGCGAAGSGSVAGGGVWAPGGLPRLQSGWDGRPPSGGFDSRPPPPTGSGSGSRRLRVVGTMGSSPPPGVPGPRMLTVCGSLQAASANRAALEAASAVAVAAGALVDDFELLAEIPPFNADLDAAGGVAVEEWRRRVASADVVLVALPEYAGAVAGVGEERVRLVGRLGRALPHASGGAERGHVRRAPRPAHAGPVADLAGRVRRGPPRHRRAEDEVRPGGPAHGRRDGDRHRVPGAPAAGRRRRPVDGCRRPRHGRGRPARHRRRPRGAGRLGAGAAGGRCAGTLPVASGAEWPGARHVPAAVPPGRRFRGTDPGLLPDGHPAGARRRRRDPPRHHLGARRAGGVRRMARSSSRPSRWRSHSRVRASAAACSTTRCSGYGPVASGG